MSTDYRAPTHAGKFTWDQLDLSSMMIQCTLYKKKEAYLPKPSTLSIHLDRNGDSKQIGEIAFDLCEYVPKQSGTTRTEIVIRSLGSLAAEHAGNK